MDLNGGALKFDALINSTDFNRQMKALEDRILGVYDRTEAESHRLDKAFTTLSATITGAFSVAAITGFVQSLVKTRGEFQQIEVAFTTMLKSKSAADKLMKEAVTLAATTPFGLQDVATGAKQLLAYGTQASEVTGTLTMLGNVAAGVSAPLGDIVYLYGTLQTQGRAYSKDIQQFTGRGIPIIKELAAQFSVSESEVMKLVEAGKVGFPEVQKAFQSMTSSSGIFYNLMQEQSKTLTGQLANLSDAWDMMLNSLGRSNEGILSGSISAATELVENYEKVLDILGVLIATYGAYRASVMLTTVAQSSAIVSLGVYDIATKRLIVSETLANVARNISIRTQRILNTTMLANPYVATATALTALAGVAYLFYKNMNNAIKAQDEVNKTINEGTASVASETTKIKDSITAIQDRTAALSVKKTAINDLRKIMPDYLKGYSDEQILAGKATEAIMRYNQALLDSAVSKALFDQKVKLQLDKMKVEGMKIDDEDNGFGLTEIIFKNKSFNEYKKDRLNAANELIKANEEAIKHQNDKIAESNKKEEEKPVIQDKKYFESQIETIKGRIDSLDKLDKDFLSKKSALQVELRNYQAGLSAFDTSDKQTEKDFDQAKRHADILNKVYDLNSKYNDKTLTDDQQKLQEIRNEYKSLQRDIDAYNKDPKNKKINPDLKPQMEKAIENKQYEIDTEHLKASLANQKQLYADYEDYKSAFGKESADKRYADELDTSISYIEKLKSERDKLLSKGIMNLSQPERDRVIMYNAEWRTATDAEKKNRDKLHAEAYQAAMSHEDSIRGIRAKYVQYTKELGSSITESQKAELIKQQNNEIKSANETAFQKTAIYRKLAEQTVIYTKDALKAEIKAAQNILKDSDLSPALKADVEKHIEELNNALDAGVNKSNTGTLEQRKKALEAAIVDPLIAGTEQAEEYRKELLRIQGLIDNMGSGTGKTIDIFKGNTKDINDNIAGSLGELSGSFNELSSALGGSDTQAGYLLGTIGELAKVGSDAAGAVASFASGDIVGGVTKTISAVSGLFSIGKKVKEMNLKARKEVSDFYDAAIKGETEYQSLLRKRELDSAARGKNSYKAIIAQLEAIKKQSPEIQKAYDRIFDSLQSGSSKEGTGYKHGTWLRKAKTWDIMASLAGSDYKNLESLDAQGKLIGQEKTNFDNLRKLKEELDAVGISAEDLQKQLGELLTGTSTSGLADGLKSLFENGKRSAQDFGDSFEEIMKNSLMNTFKAKYLDDALQPFFEELATMMETGTPSDEQIAALKAKYVKIGEDADAYLKNVEEITGQKLGKDDPSALKPNSLTASMNQPTAERLEGLWRGQYDLTDQIKSISLEMLDIDRRQLELSEKFGLGFQDQLSILNSVLLHIANIDTNTLRSANNTERLKTMEESLTAIEKNTKSNKSTRD